MKYLVTGAEGPGFVSPEEGVAVLEKGTPPVFVVFFPACELINSCFAIRAGYMKRGTL